MHSTDAPPRSAAGRTRVAAVLLGLAACLAAAGVTAAAPTLLPVDEATQDPEFFAFRARLQAAVARRDLEALRAVLAPDIKNSFGGNEGLAGFEEQWTPMAADSKLWPTLATLLALGGSFDGGDRFVAPYVFSRWPDGLDAFEHIAILGRAVRARAAPDAAATAVDAFDFALLPVADPIDPDAAWVGVRRSDGSLAYVDGRYARSPLDYRAYFDRRDGRWQLVMLLAGD